MEEERSTCPPKTLCAPRSPDSIAQVPSQSILQRSCSSLARRLGKQLQKHRATASYVRRGSGSRLAAGSRSIPGPRIDISCPRSRCGRRGCALTPGLRQTCASSRRGRGNSSWQPAVCSSPKTGPDREWGGPSAGTARLGLLAQLVVVLGEVVVVDQFALSSPVNWFRIYCALSCHR